MKKWVDPKYNQKEKEPWLPVYGAAESSGKQQKPRTDKKAGSGSAAGASNKKIAKKGDKLKEDMDNLVDEIDNVLEENAEEFVKNYVQRGGQ